MTTSTQQEPHLLPPNGGALLIDKHEGVSSFGVLEQLQRELRRLSGGKKRRELPKLGHGGTLDPFATGLLIVCVGNAAKLARYFLGSVKTYEGVIRFGETTIPGDPTAPVSETSEQIPESRKEIQEAATRFTQEPYLQTPPMHSAKKQDGKPLYELARQGLEVERAPKLCQIHSFEISSYEKPRASFRVSVSSGTYIRVLAQDLARSLGSVALLDSLRRSGSGIFSIERAWSVSRVLETSSNPGRTVTGWESLPCWVPFDRLLDGYDHVQATDAEAQALIHGRQGVLVDLVHRAPWQKQSPPPPVLTIRHGEHLLAVARKTDEDRWEIERVFT